MLDVAYARTHFPALNQGWTLFENAGGSVAPRQVIELVHDYMTRCHVQLGATYPQSIEATERVRAGIAAAAALINAAPDEIVLGASTTMNAYVLANALSPRLSPGDEIVVTNLDHESNIGAWRRLADRGAVIKEWRFRPETMTLEPDDLDLLLTERTRLVCFTHCSNIVGVLTDVAAATERAHRAGALVCVDGVAYAPHRAVDVKALDVDFYLISLYKVYGPHIGLLYAKREHLAAVANQNHFFLEAAEPSYKLEPGYVNHELTAALPGILAYLDAIDQHHHTDRVDRAASIARVFALFAAHEQRLATLLVDYLNTKRGIHIVGPATGAAHLRVPTISFTVADRDASEIPPLFEQSQIAIRAGDFYARRATDALGLGSRGGVVRVSMVHYNTEAEVLRLIAALDRIL